MKYITNTNILLQQQPSLPLEEQRLNAVLAEHFSAPFRRDAACVILFRDDDEVTATS